MNSMEEHDGETALFRREMRGDKSHSNLRRLINSEPFETRIDQATLRRLLQRHNEAIALLREFLAVHPEGSDLARRAHHLVDNPE